MTATSPLEVRQLAPAEDARAAALLVQVRDTLEVAELARRIGVQRAAHGYALAGAFRGDALLGVIGPRPGLVSVFLDSRPEVIDFYRHRGYRPHTATLMRRRLEAAP